MTARILPFHFGAPGRTLFGWYHPPRGVARPSAVVLCPPIGDDLIRAHRTFRHLAEQLAAAGFPVLRFDFHGTGDSDADECAPDRVAAWIDDVGAAVAAVRAQSGAAQICLVGLRLGGTVAAAWAARHGGADSLILWSPHVDGESFLRESTRLHAMHKLLEPDGFALEPPGYAPDGQEVLGFLLTPPTIAEHFRAHRSARRGGPAGSQRAGDRHRQRAGGRCAAAAPDLARCAGRIPAYARSQILDIDSAPVGGAGAGAGGDRRLGEPAAPAAGHGRRGRAPAAVESACAGLDRRSSRSSSANSCLACWGPAAALATRYWGRSSGDHSAQRRHGAPHRPSSNVRGAGAAPGWSTASSSSASICRASATAPRVERLAGEPMLSRRAATPPT